MQGIYNSRMEIWKAQLEGKIRSRCYPREMRLLNYMFEDLGFGISIPQVVLWEGGAMPMCRLHCACGVPGAEILSAVVPIELYRLLGVGSRS